MLPSRVAHGIGFDLRGEVVAIAPAAGVLQFAKRRNMMTAIQGSGRKAVMGIRTIRSIIMDQALISAAPHVSVSDAARLMKHHRIGAIVILESERLAGIFTERDALFRVVAEGRDPNATAIAEVMTRDPTSIAPDQPFSRALEIMHAGRFRHVPVVESGRAIGMVSSRDAMGPELETFMYQLIVEDEARNVLA